MNYLEELTEPGFIESVKESCYEVLSCMQRDNIAEMITRFKARKVSFLYWDADKACGCFVGTYAFLEGDCGNSSYDDVEMYLAYHAPFVWNANECHINGFFCNYIKDALTKRERDNLDMVIGWMESYLTLLDLALVLLAEEDNA